MLGRVGTDLADDGADIELQACAGTQFDPAVVEVLVAELSGVGVILAS